MKLKKLEIKNYRSLKDVSIEFEDLTVLIGKNDAGKSNVLKALDLFFNWRKSQDYNEISHGGGSGNDLGYNSDIIDYRLFFSQIPATIEITGYVELERSEIESIFPNEEISVQGTTYRMSELGNIVAVSYKITGKGDKTANWNLNHINMGQLQLVKGRGDRVLLKDNAGNYTYKGGGTQLYVSIIQKMSDISLFVPAVRSIQKENRVTDMPLPNGRNIPSYYLRLEKDRSLLNGKKVFGTIKGDISRLFPEYNRIETMEEESQAVIFFDNFPSSSVGEGIKQFFITAHHLELYRNKICGIEEPEIHFHPKKQREIFNYLKEQSKKRQIIITTHSPIFVSNSEGIKTHLVSMDKGTKETKILPIDGRKEFKQIKGEIGARNTDLFFDDCVVLIEGESEDMAFPIIADAMGHDLAEKGIKLKNMSGSGRIKRQKIKEFLEYLRDSDVILYVIMDNDDGVNGYVQDLVRGGLLKKENYKIWDGEFEECFGEERIIRAMKEIAKENGFKFDISLEELRKKKKELGKPITKTLNRILREGDLRDLNKPMLGEKLALIIKEEIEKNPKGREKTEPEKTIEKIINIVEEGV